MRLSGVEAGLEKVEQSLSQNSYGYFLNF
jgi:hypothetical protein